MFGEEPVPTGVSLQIESLTIFYMQGGRFVTRKNWNGRTGNKGRERGRERE